MFWSQIEELKTFLQKTAEELGMQLSHLKGLACNSEKLRSDVWNSHKNPATDSHIYHLSGAERGDWRQVNPRKKPAALDNWIQYNHDQRSYLKAKVEGAWRMTPEIVS